MAETHETCIACEVAFKAGDEFLPDIGGGFIHMDCCGPEPESLVDLETGEPLAEKPEPLIWEADHG
jgi:hypothetical protein